MNYFIEPADEAAYEKNGLLQVPEKRFNIIASRRNVGSLNTPWVVYYRVYISDDDPAKLVLTKRSRVGDSC